jgi:hypothetical protein
MIRPGVAALQHPLVREHWWKSASAVSDMPTASRHVVGMGPTSPRATVQVPARFVDEVSRLEADDSHCDNNRALLKMATRDIVLITAGPFHFLASFESVAPRTVTMFRSLLPYHQKLIHVRWSGEGMWIPLGDEDFGVGYENHTSHPAAGQILFHPGGFSETEILFCYGGVAFASKMGPLAANHFLTITEGHENLRSLGEMVLWKGAQDIAFELADPEK